MAPNESTYSHCVIQRKTDKKFYVADNEWGDIFQARRFKKGVRPDDTEKAINAALKEIEERNKQDYIRDAYPILKVDVVFSYSPLAVAEPFDAPEELL